MAHDILRPTNNTIPLTSFCCKTPMDLPDAAKNSKSFENFVAAIVDRGSTGAAVSDRGYKNKPFRDS